MKADGDVKPEELEKSFSEAQAMLDELRWKDSFCPACNEAGCFGECPGYEAWEAEFLRGDGNG